MVSYNNINIGNLVVQQPSQEKLLLLQEGDGSCKRKKKECSLSSFYLKVRTFSFIMSYFLKFEISYFFFLYYLLSSHFYFFFYSTLYYPTCYHFKFILENWFFLHLLLFIPTVMNQMPKLFIILTYSFSSSFQFYPQFSEGVLLVKQTTHEKIVLELRHHVDALLVQNKQLISLVILHLLEYKIFIQLESYYPTNYCPNSIVRLLPNKWDP